MLLGVYQRIVAANREPPKIRGKQMMQPLIDSITSGVPAALIEIRRVGRTQKQRAVDVLAFFDRPGTSNGPTEAINGHREHLRGSALGFRNLTHYEPCNLPVQQTPTPIMDSTRRGSPRMNVPE